MKAGEYVRTKYGSIYKIDEIGEYSGNVYATDDTIIQGIIKSSQSLIDLIEDKDLIKIEYKLATGQKQQEILEVIKNREEKLFVNSWIRKMFIEEFKNFDIEIKSILTKEQFESMEYKVKE